MLGILADHEPVDILQKDQRHMRLIAIHHKPGGLVGAVGVDHAAVLKRAGRRFGVLPLIGDDADRHTGQSADPADQRLAILGLVLVER